MRRRIPLRVVFTFGPYLQDGEDVGDEEGGETSERWDQRTTLLVRLDVSWQLKVTFNNAYFERRAHLECNIRVLR